MSEDTTTDNDGKRLGTRFRPDTIGHVFGTMVAVGGGVFLLSFFSVFGYAILANPPDGAPLPLPITIAGIGSWTCVTAGLWGYVVWGSWTLRNHRQEPRRSEREVISNSDNRTLHQKRRQRIFFAAGLGLFALLTPVAIVAGFPGR